MGLFDKLRGAGRGVLTTAKPEEGVPPAPVDEVVRRLQAIQGKGIETRMDGDEVVVSWSALVQDVGAGGAGHMHAYRAIRIALDPSENQATGICTKTTTTGEVSWDGSFGLGGEWERGQHIGIELLHVVAWLGPHRTEGGADEKGYKFSWSSLRDPVLDAVTGAGWSYKPKKV